MVPYKGVYLAKGSHGLELYEKKQFKELDAHLKELDRKEKDLLERYRVKTEVEVNSQYLKDVLNGSQTKRSTD